MADDGTLTIVLKGQWGNLDELADQLSKAMNKPVRFQQDVIAPAPDAGDTGRSAGKGERELGDVLKDYLSDENNQRKLITNAIRSTETTISAGLRKGFSIVEDIYARLKSASPLLQAIESLFQLAMTLFFMPLGNKLGEILIPATVELLDKVVDMWDAFEGMTLGEMFSYAIEHGVKLIGDYFNNVSDILIDQGGMVANVGRLIQFIGNFISGPGATVVSNILNITTTVLANIKHFISLWVAMKAAEMAINAMGVFGELGGGTVVAVTALAALAAGATAEIGMSAIGLADGGYVPATPGGQLRVIGEGGRGEYVIPEDRMDSFKGRGQEMTLNFYGYNEDQLVQKVHDVVSQEISQSRLRSGF